MIDYITGGDELLQRIEPLWSRLREHHVATSVYFKAELAAARFESRRDDLARKGRAGELLVLIARDAAGDFGYIVCSVVDGGGEIDSLFVDNRGRQQGIGTELVRRGMAWLASRQASPVRVSVIHGNEQVLKLYSKFAILPRSLCLCKK